MTQDLHPAHGLRVLLEFESSNASGAHYHSAIYTPTERFDYAVHIAIPGGAVTIAEPASGPVDIVRALARTLARDALAHDPAGWPRRLLRWRPLQRTQANTAFELDVRGLISYRRSDGLFVHMLGDADGFARKLAQLGIATVK